MTERTEPRWVDRVAAMVTNPAFAGLSNGAKAVAAVLPPWMDQRGQVFPSIATLVEVAGVSRSTALRALDDLVAAGIIRLVERSRHHRPAVYELGPDATRGCRGELLRGFGRGGTGDTSEDARGVTDDMSGDASGVTSDTSGSVRGATGDTSDDARGSTDDTSGAVRGVTRDVREVSPVTPEVRTEVPPLPPQAVAEVASPAIAIVRRGKPDAGFVSGVLELGARVDARKAAGARLDPRVLRWRERRVEEFWRAGGTLAVAESVAEAALAAPRSMDASGIFWADLAGGPARCERTVAHRREDLKHAQSLDLHRKAAREAERAADLGRPQGLGPRPLSDIDLDGIYGAPRSAKG